MKLKPQRFIPQGALVRISEAAADCWRRQDFPKLIELLEPAIRLDPANSRMLLDLGLAYSFCRNFAKAEQYLERAIRVAPNKAETLLKIGSHYGNLERFDLAKKFLERAVQEKGAPAAAFAQLAEIYERQRRMENATQMVERALHLDANCTPALLVRARLNRQTGQLEEAENNLRALLVTNSSNASARVTVWYELGTTLDRQGRFDDAMAAFQEAKALLLPDAALHLPPLKRMQAQVAEMKQNISESMLRRWHETGQALQPPRRLALLGGHPRSGTTLLEQVLDSHPEIVSAEETEILHENIYLPFERRFFPGRPIVPAIDSVTANDLQPMRNGYVRAAENFLGAPLGHRLFIDKNPSLTVILPLVARVFPETRFLIALRDPRDVCLSCFMQMMPLNPATVPWLTLEETVADYASMMSLWLALKPILQNPAIEIRYEDMVENLEPVARRALDFLGVAWDEKVLRFDEHARSKTVKSPTYAEVTKPIFKTAVGRWKNYEKYLGPHLEKLGPFLKAFGYE